MGASASGKANDTVAHQLASVLPSDERPWYRQSHLFRLNSIVFSFVLFGKSSLPHLSDILELTLSQKPLLMDMTDP